MQQYDGNIIKTGIRGERALWRAVITQALMDASSHSQKMELKYEKSQALCWLTGNSEDFRSVCENAGFDPLYIRQQAVEALERDCQWRMPAQPKRTTIPTQEPELCH
jgi:hypothetical protein